MKCTFHAYPLSRHTHPTHSHIRRGDDLKELFARYGPIRDVYIPVDYYTKEPRGFCYVEYPFIHY